MNYSTGKLAFILTVAVFLSCTGAWVVAYRYRAAMRRLMSAPSRVAGAAADLSSAQLPASPSLIAPPRLVSAQDNQRAGQRLAVGL